MEKSGHKCPKCEHDFVYCVKFSRNVNGTFFNLYKCANCEHEFENIQSHKEADNER